MSLGYIAGWKPEEGGVYNGQYILNNKQDVHNSLNSKAI